MIFLRYYSVFTLLFCCFRVKYTIEKFGFEADNNEGKSTEIIAERI